jgi:hypothetical protein
VAERDETSSTRRPIFLVIALVAMWLVGMNAAAEGWVAIQVVRSPLDVAPTTVGAPDLETVVRTAFVAALSASSKTALPLGIAELIVGALLVGVAAKALFGRRASPSFALQVIMANVAVLVLGYSLRQPLRARVVEAVVASGVEERPPQVSEQDFQDIVRTKWWWSFRVGLSIQLMVLGLSALAITRRSARELLAPAESRPGEES